MRFYIEVSNVDIIQSIVNKLYDLAAMQPQIPASVKEHYADLTAHASDCIACKACESRCPFEVPITERMKQAVRLFGF